MEGIYDDRKESLIREKIIGAAQELQDEADQQVLLLYAALDLTDFDTIGRAMRKLNLPSSLEALERPVGLPPSLLGKAEEVRLEDGPAKIEVSIEDVQKLAQHDRAILDEVKSSSLIMNSDLTMEISSGYGYS
jgi:programmed cell death 6-interacting protein